MTAELTTNIERAAEVLRSGRLVAFATETVYGLGANALDEGAVARIFEAKERPFFDPLIVHLAQADDVTKIVSDVSPPARRLMDRFWPGPLTLVLPKRDVVPDLVTAGLPNVAVRVPDHAVARELIRLSGVPVAAPSANPFGRISPTTSQHVMVHLAARIDMVLDGGDCRIGVESTVLQLLPDEAPLLLRPGGLTLEEIEAEIGPVSRLESTEGENVPQTSPGRLPKHYAPRKNLQLIDKWNSVPCGPRVGALLFRPMADLQEFGQVEVLSESGNLTEAAAHFFAALRRLDDASIDLILAERFPDHGLGRALNDRLSRAVN